MSSTPQEALRKYQECVEGAKTGYTVFMTYVNLDFRSNPEDDLMGIVIPCGSYESEDLAMKARDEISAVTGCPTVTYCRNGTHYPFTSNFKKNSTIYETSDKDSLVQIRESIYEARRKQKKLEKKIDQEKEEREEPESMSRMINLIYKVVISEARISDILKTKAEIEKQYEISKDALYKLAQSRPDLYENWIDEAKERFEERGELEKLLFKQMVIGMKPHDECIRSLLSTERSKEV